MHTVFSETTWAFTASGPAVDAAFVCSDGSVESLSLAATGRRGLNLQIDNQFTCSDGSGSFVVKLQVHLDKRGDNYSWNVLRGTDGYASLHGAGTGFGIGFDGGVEDYYVGQVRLG